MTDRWDPTYPALGRLVVHASRLEFLIALAYDRARPDPDDPDVLRLKDPGQSPVSTLACRMTKLADAYGEVSMVRWLTACRDLIERRNAYLHASWMDVRLWTGVDEIALPPRHARSGAVLDDGPDAIDGLVSEIDAAFQVGCELIVGPMPSELVDRLMSPEDLDRYRREHGYRRAAETG